VELLGHNLVKILDNGLLQIPQGTTTSFKSPNPKEDFIPVVRDESLGGYHSPRPPTTILAKAIPSIQGGIDTDDLGKFRTTSTSGRRTKAT
jgi:hypothetical protein